jgi:hypothetical protein
MAGRFRKFGAGHLQKGNHMTKTRWSALTTTLLAIATVACSDGAGRFSPTAPSTLAEPAALVATASAADWATVNGWSTMGADGRVAVADGLVVEGADVIGAVSGACPAVTITVRGIPVAVTAMTTFSAPLSCVSLSSGQGVRVTGLLVQTAAGFAVTALNLAGTGTPDNNRAPAPAPSRGGERLSGEGVVGGVSGSCPALTFFIMGHRVHATASTAYANGVCESLREGTHVKLDVEKHADGTIFAERVEFVLAR